MPNIDSDLIRGNIDTIILKTMLNEDKYGLDIIKEVSDKSSGTYELKQPTLYSCLKRLENQGLLSSYFVDSEIGGKRHYYKLTDKGRDFYNKKQEEWSKSKFIIDNLLSNYNYEEYRLVKKDEYDQILQDKANAPIHHNSNEITENETEQENHVDGELETNTDNSEDSLTELNQQDDEDIFNFETNNEFNFNSSETTEENSDDKIKVEVNDNEDDTYPVYFKTETQNDDETEESKSNVSYETEDQSSNEMNILSRLHSQENEEINTYYGDQKSYINHLNMLDESQLEQQNLLDDSLYIKPSLVDDSINDFSNAVNSLNNFNNPSQEESQINEDENDNNENFENEINPEIENTDTDTGDFENEPDDLDELKNLKQNQSTAFFDSYDNANYNLNYEINYNNENHNEYDYDQTDSSDASFESDYDDENECISLSDIQKEIEPQTESDYEENQCANNQNNEDKYFYNQQNKFSEIDSIITNNITSTYTQPTQALYKAQSAGNYRDKLSNLSMYSRVKLDDTQTEPKNNEEAVEKAKDISVITKELEEEGIKIKEHYKSTNSKSCEKNYLLSNKINLMKSLIMFFGYVFILSAIYIVLNNTPLKEKSWFKIGSFLIGFIPFAIVLIYNAIAYFVNPYKKTVAKYHSRIMFFISIIITIQLLLITYCVNLQFGFYSFRQQEYNHLYWIIPTIISFAPIIDNLIYLALYKSKNFNV